MDLSASAGKRSMRAGLKIVGAVLMAISACGLCAENSTAVQSRDYPFPLPAVKQALQQLGAYTGSRLPSLDGFIASVRADLGHYERPYYEYKIELQPAAVDRTTVRVKANVSAWYAEGQGGESGYVAFESNGRLENDLLDRLNELLTKNQSKIATDPETVVRQLAALRQQRLEAERRVAELQKQLQAPPAAGQTSSAEIVSVIRPPVAVVSAPQENASVVLRTQSEDEFEVLEHRGPWLRVKLSDTTSGWVKRGQVRQSVPAGSADEQPSDKTEAGAYTIIREMVSPFSGEWTRLNGKQALYLWARPEGSIRDVALGQKLKFVEDIFRQRYREVTHSSQSPVEGIVVIFLDKRGGVAAATLEDIAGWADGNLSQTAFLKKCSLDPPGAFENAVNGPRARLP
jgi:hypothetical protein